MKKIFYLLLGYVLKTISILLLVFCLITLLAQFSHYISNVNKYPIFSAVLQHENKVNHMVKEILPTKINNIDASRWITIILLYLASGFTGRGAAEFFYRAELIKYSRDLDDWRVIKDDLKHSNKLTHAEDKYKEFKHAKNKKDRDQLLKEFIKLKKDLELMGKDLAFLAIDVVDSTGMKINEDPAIVQHDFEQYHTFIETYLKQNNCMKSSWTPDGVMACFETVEQAVIAAREIITELAQFNKTTKNIQRDFKVRCGINAGFVYFDESLPLEKIADRVIDIAGHMQKYADPNTICLNRSFIDPIQDKKGFIKVDKVVDGYEVSEWRG